MQELELKKVYDSTSLKSTVAYHIDCYLYRFLCRDAFSPVNAPKYKFSPLPNQRRKSSVTVNHKQLITKVYEVPNYTISSNATDTEEAQMQTSLFNEF